MTAAGQISAGSAFATRVRSGETLFGTFAALGSPLTVEICGLAGFDWVLVDMEHGAGDQYVLLQQLHAIGSTRAEGIVRVALNSRVAVTKALDRGAAGVMIPRIDSALEAREAVSHVRYPPAGDRGVALMNRGAGFGSVSISDLRASEPLLAIQIETLPALRNVADIAATEGVDILFVGPSDLTWALGIPGELDNATFRTAVSEVANAAAANSKAAGVLIGSVDMAPPYLELGYTFIGVSADAGLLQVAARTAVTQLKRSAGLST